MIRQQGREYVLLPEAYYTRPEQYGEHYDLGKLYKAREAQKTLNALPKPIPTYGGYMTPAREKEIEAENARRQAAIDAQTQAAKQAWADYEYTRQYGIVSARDPAQIREDIARLEAERAKLKPYEGAMPYEAADGYRYNDDLIRQQELDKEIIRLKREMAGTVAADELRRQIKALDDRLKEEMKRKREDFRDGILHGEYDDSGIRERLFDARRQLNSIGPSSDATRSAVPDALAGLVFSPVGAAVDVVDAVANVFVEDPEIYEAYSRMVNPTKDPNVENIMNISEIPAGWYVGEKLGALIPIAVAQGIDVAGLIGAVVKDIEAKKTTKDIGGTVLVSAIENALINALGKLLMSN